MVTYKSLIVSLAFILALLGAGILAASAHTLASAQQQNTVQLYRNGIAAISAAAGLGKHVSFQDVKHYIKSKGFVGGSTLTGATPALKDLQLISIVHLDRLLYSLLPHLPGNKSVYYAQLEGPFIVLPQLSLPVLTTLIPSKANQPALIPHLSNLSSLGLTSPLFGLLPPSNLKQPHTLPGLPGSHKATSGSSGIFRMPDLSNLQSNNFGVKPHVSTPHANPRSTQAQNSSVQANVLTAYFQDNDSRLSQNDVDTIINTAYEVFDADNGNLLAWG